VLLVYQRSPDFFAKCRKNCCRRISCPILNIFICFRNIFSQSLKSFEIAHQILHTFLAFKIFFQRECSQILGPKLDYKREDKFVTNVCSYEATCFATDQWIRHLLTVSDIKFLTFIVTLDYDVTY